VPNDDRCFPGRSAQQITGLGEGSGKFLVNKITSHFGKGNSAWFELLLQSGDCTWLQYTTSKHLAAMDDYLENMVAELIDSLPLGSGTPPWNIHDHIDFPEAIPHRTQNVHEASELQTSSMWVDENVISLKGSTKFTHISLPTNILSNINHTMPPNNNDLVIGTFYEYLYKLAEGAMTNAPHPGNAPHGYIDWATLHGKPRDLQEVRNRMPRTGPAYMDPNGDAHWIGNHPNPAAASQMREPAYGSYAASSAGGPLMSATDHFAMMQRYRDFDRSLLREEGDRQSSY
jgi:hypothetical protein